ncbi:hypothetical protein ADIARSV_2513 [Arcticibacter svalbardensis MN12-7]|uniref:HEPN domain-containing protein n=1 Tax=Arcticibacter svalbardensis MN12-7 TaxID=1150600 RepID=R9GR12_9SPHI|nr:hypothetical protein [Arcticibacter svalbardensis]EOR94272.1 hypothetical protein ADIARSV_2513 [Arcticibacter svalbardensis MN12-7]
MSGETVTNSFLKEANDYYKVSVGGLNRRNIFTNEILYNTISLSIEKYIMGFFVSRKEMLQCHTLNGMISELKRYMPVEDNLVSQIRYFDNMQQICSLATYNKNMIADDDISNMIDVLHKIKGMILSNLDQKN